MPTYKVTLIMSEEYFIKAPTREDAEKEARARWGSDYYIDDVKVEEISR